MNAVRGEVPFRIAGRTHCLCLTLGALAQIMSALDCVSITQLLKVMGELDEPRILALLLSLLRGGGCHAAASALSESPEPWDAINSVDAAHAVAHAFEAAFAADGANALV
ncbi:MAG: GTA-gp10 family protein [Pseudomonadota bacterium]